MFTVLLVISNAFAGAWTTHCLQTIARSARPIRFITVVLRLLLIESDSSVYSVSGVKANFITLRSLMMGKSAASSNAPHTLCNILVAILNAYIVMLRYYTTFDADKI